MMQFTAISLLAFFVCYGIAWNHPRLSLHREEDKPKLTLPWGTWEGEKYDESGETTLFRNVRFGQAPVGDLRFAAPKYPENKTNKHEVQDSSYGPSCIGVNPIDKKNVSGDPIAAGTQSEDCLFLDLYVPSWALEEKPTEEQLPVVVYLYGGAYIFGGKNATVPAKEDGLINIYDARGLGYAAQQSVIWVVGNYRLGAYGFLAGSTVESHAQPNAGLHDQRLLLDWVQKYIGNVYGNKSEVGIWGSSAGAGSIMHHLTAYGGKKKENLFRRAALFSTAFQWGYDRSGTLEETFKNFSKAADCSGSGASTLQCLRSFKANDEKLIKANENIIQERLNLGLFPFGPAVDNDLVPDLPAVSLKKGAKVPVDSLLLSHVFDEASPFLAKWVDSPEDFAAFLKMAFPGSSLSSVREQIEKQYPAKLFDLLQKDRMRQVLADSSFLCNKRQMFKAYNGDSTTIHALSYAVPPAFHGIDLFHLFWSDDLDMVQVIKNALPDPLGFLADFLNTIWAAFSFRYQQYLAGYAVLGRPNWFTDRSSTHWPAAYESEGYISDSLRVQIFGSNGFTVASEPATSDEVCSFWENIAEQISKATAKEADKNLGFGLFTQTDDEM